MPDPKVCAACGTPAADADNSDDLDVCAACLGLHVQLAPREPEPPNLPTARRTVEEPPAPAATPPPLEQGIRWREAADGYRYLRNALLTLMASVPAFVTIRILETLGTDPRQRPGGHGLLDTPYAPLVFVLIVAAAVIQFLTGAVALARKPCDEGEKWLPWMLCISAFIPGVNLIVFPLLLSLYTHGVGVDLGKRSVTRSAGILFVCSLILVPPVVFAVKVVFDLVVDRALDDRLLSPVGANAEPVATELLFGVGAGAVLWLGAYVVTIMVLSGVARAIERAIRVQPASNDPAAHFDHLRDATRPGESRDDPT